MSREGDIVDRTRAVREGEELDMPKLTAYLDAHLEGGAKQIDVEQFPGGHSNLTYMIRVANRSGDLRELVLRRPPFGNRVKSAHDMTREVTMLSALAPVYPPAPKPLVSCEDEAVIGAPFYVMERIRGAILRRTLPPGFTISPGEACRLSESFVDNLATLHAIDWEKIGLSKIAKPEGYVERQVTGWAKRYADAATDSIPDMDRVGSWLERHLPPATNERARATVVHNDYKLDNLVLGENDLAKILGVLDWEMSTIGDPLMDLGVVLGYWIESSDSDEVKSFAFGPTTAPGMLSRREIAERYAQKTGRDVSKLLFYYVFALFKLAGVAQQIYWRYKMGHTKDERFAAFIFGVRILAEQASRALDRDKI